MGLRGFMWEETAKKVVKVRGWKWVDGMKSVHYGDSGIRYEHRLDEEMARRVSTGVSCPGAFPDLSDPATAVFMLIAARMALKEVHRADSIITTLDLEEGGWSAEISGELPGVNGFPGKEKWATLPGDAVARAWLSWEHDLSAAR